MTNVNKRGTILVVEDSPSVAFVVGRELRRVGWTVQTARLAAHALDLLHRETFEVVICDLHLPGMDGFGLLDQISRANPDLPVVMFSGDEGVAAILGAVRRGAFDYVVKSDDWGLLLNSVERAAAHHSMLRENQRLKAELLGHVDKLEQEIVDRKAAEQALELARDQAEAGSKAKSAFLANMSHELRTPLNAILGYAEMVGDDLDDSGQDEHASDLRRIQGAGVHLLSLINDVLDLAKIESGNTLVHLEAVSIQDVLQTAIDTSEVLAAKNHNVLKMDIPPLAPIVTDSRKLRQCVLNLIGNACKFTENGTVTVRVTEEVASGRPWVLVEVHDTGIGMTPAQCQKVFEPFVQADTSTTRKHGGTGLGLPITNRLAELMGGHLSVSSVFGVGTSFTIRIPADLNAPRPDSALSESTHPNGTSGQYASSVLVIDEDPSVHRLLRRYIKGTDLTFLSASTGEDGWNQAQEYVPDVIVLDVMLPDMDGYELLNRLKRDTRLRHVPIILSSVVDRTEGDNQLGASGYLQKPVQRESLLATLAEHGVLPSQGDILVVDDDWIQREILGRLLATEGWPYTLAKNGQQALAHMEANTPSLVLLDLQMPVVDGYEVLARMSSDSRFADIPVVVITATDLSDTQRTYLSDRTLAVVGKVDAPESMGAQVQELLRHSLAPGSMPRES